jgi:hypothetical protein
MKNFRIYLYIILVLGVSACGGNRLNVDVSTVDLPDYAIDRLEQDVFNMDTTNVLAATEKLQKKYGHFYTTYVTGVLNNGGIRDSSYSFRMKRFINDRDMKEAYADCQQHYPNTDFLKEQLSGAFQHFNYYFPKRSLPRTITMISGFNYPVVAVDSTLAIGLEMYLGSNNKFYTWMALPRYRTMFMNKENIVPDAVRCWMGVEFPSTMNKTDFLSDIIYMGKILYLTDALLPEMADTLKIQYSKQQMGYCKQNEFNVWSYFIAEKLLYTTNQADIMKYTSDGPFTAALSKEAPPRIGHWIGWQIVKQYMDKNKEVTLEQLMEETDAQKILTKAKYKPQK